MQIYEDAQKRTEYCLKLEKRIAELEFQVQKLTVEKEDNFQLACDWEQQFRKLEDENVELKCEWIKALRKLKALGGDDE